ncbi:EAL domain-containing protein [Virgibacillus sp. DJP39]|uniref:EAL domain-containing protein n=1 Tax=Virgibacillus sp. DJP39 TaxID=3409790 RepID=UPI003BB5D243
MEKSNLEESKLYINIFPSTLTNPEFQHYIKKIRSNTAIHTRSIFFEINEAERVAGLETIQQSIGELKQLGFLIALDDIGKGESTLQSILELKPDIAKVDRYFSYELSNSHRKQRLIKLMLDLLKVIPQWCWKYLNVKKIYKSIRIGCSLWTRILFGSTTTN